MSSRKDHLSEAINYTMSRSDNKKIALNNAIASDFFCKTTANCFGITFITMYK